MSSRIIERGRTVGASMDWRKPPRPPEKIDVDVVYAPPEVQLGNRRGPDMKDADGVTYRVIDKMRIADGWGTADFWIRLLGVAHKDVLLWAKRGLLDPAIENGSPTKRYRCPDYARLKADVAARKKAEAVGRTRRARR